MDIKPNNAGMRSSKVHSVSEPVLGVILGHIFLSSIIHLSFASVTQDPNLPSIRQLTADKGSSLHLNWTFTESNHGTITERVCGYQNGTKTTPLATGIPLQISTNAPAYFSGRVSISNSTLILQNLQFNDTGYNFTSYVISKNLSLGSLQKKIYLKPIYQVTVAGPPEYVKKPASNIEVAEGSSIVLEASVNSNPRPNAEFELPHVNAKISVSTSEQYPYVYKGSCLLRSVTASYCGGVVRTSFFNGKDRTRTVETAIKLKLNASLGFSVSKPNNSCFDIKWKKRNPGNCKINYNVAFISSSNYILDSVMADHSGSLLKCFSSQVKNIAKVNLTISSNATTEAKALITLPTPITVVATTNTKRQGKGESTVGRRISNFHIGYAVAVVLLLGLVLIFGIRVFKVRRMKKKENINDDRHNRRFNEMNASMRPQYMDIQLEYAENAQNTQYAALENAGYEVTRTEEYSNFNQGYVNFSSDYVNVQKR